MAGFAQTTINKINQVYDRWMPELASRSECTQCADFLRRGFVMYWFNHGGIGFDALCRAHA